MGDSDDSAISGTDYAAVANFDIAIPAGDTSATGTFSLNPTDDSIAEGSEVLTVDGASGNLDVTEAEVTITDDDAAATGVTLTVDADTSTDGIQTAVSEDGGAKTVRVTATLGGTTTFAEDKDVTVTVGKSDDSATKGTDYETIADQTITIGAGDTSAYVDFTLTPKQDILAEGTEIIALDGEADGLTVTDAEISLTDDDAAPTGILLAVAPDTVGEEDATTEITVTATIDGDAVAPTETVVTVSVGGGTATPDEDYEAVEAFTITVPAGQASAAGTFDLTPTDDTVEESDETITVSGTSGDLSVTGSSITLADDDTTTTLALTVDADTSTDGIQTSVSEDGGAKTVRVTATIDGTTTFSEATNVTVTVGKTDDSATESTDYEAVADQTITIAAGESSAHVDFTLTPIQDTLVESTETIALDGEATGLTVTDTEISLTDDDAEPIGITLTVAPNSIGEEDATTEVTVTATINGDIVAPADTLVTVNVGGGGSATPDDDYEAVEAFTITIPSGQASATGTFDLTPIDDAIEESNETITVAGTASDFSVTASLVTITDDDAVDVIVDLNRITLAVNPASVSEGAGATEVTVTATVTTASESSTVMRVSIGAASDSAVEGTDYAIVDDFDLTIEAEESSGTGTFTLAPVDNDADAPDKSLTISGTSVSLDVLSATLTITDDDQVIVTSIIEDDDEVIEIDIPVEEEVEPSAITVYAMVPSATATARSSSTAQPILLSSSSITEGEPATFMVKATPAPIDEPLTVKLMVRDAQMPSNFMMQDHEVYQSVTIPAGQSSASLSVPTQDDETDEMESPIMVELMSDPDTEYLLNIPRTAAVLVNDNDPTTVILSVPDATTTAGELGETAMLRLDQNRGLMRREQLKVPITIAGGTLSEGYNLTLLDAPQGVTLDGNTVIFEGNGEVPMAAVVDIRLSTPAGISSGTLVASIPKSSTDGQPRLIATNMGGGAVGITRGDGQITVKGYVSSPDAWLVRFGRSLSEQVLTSISDRISAPRTAGLDGALAGQALPNFADSATTPLVTESEEEWEYTIEEERSVDSPFVNGSSVDINDESSEESSTITEREALLSTKFSLTTPADESGGTLALWSQILHTSFDGQEESLSLNGEVNTSILGADYARGKWLTGLLLSRSKGDGGQSSEEPTICPAAQGSTVNTCAGPLRDGNADIEASMTSVIAYAARKHSERTELWGALGHGTGELIVGTAINGTQRTDTAWSMAAAGIRSNLVDAPDEGSNPTLTLVSDALWTGISSDSTRFMEASRSYATRLRLGLEGGWSIDLQGDSTLTPKLEVGVRYDGGDAEKGFGIDLGGGIGWKVPSSGITLDASGRVLAVHNDGNFKDWGLSASLVWDPHPETKRGPSLTFGQELGGRSGGGLDALFESGPPGAVSSADGAMQISLEMAYSFGLRYGMVGGPYGRLSGRESLEGTRLGYRIEPDAPQASDITLDLWTQPTEANSVGFELEWRW